MLGIRVLKDLDLILVAESYSHRRMAYPKVGAAAPPREASNNKWRITCEGLRNGRYHIKYF